MSLYQFKNIFIYQEKINQYGIVIIMAKWNDAVVLIGAGGGKYKTLCKLYVKRGKWIGFVL